MSEINIIGQILSLTSNRMKFADKLPPELEAEIKLIASFSDLSNPAFEKGHGNQSVWQLFEIASVLERLGMSFSESNMIAQNNHGDIVKDESVCLVSEALYACSLNIKDSILYFLEERLGDSFTEELGELSSNYIDDNLSTNHYGAWEFDLKNFLISLDLRVLDFSYQKSVDPDDCIIEESGLSDEEYLEADYYQFCKDFFAHENHKLIGFAETPEILNYRANAESYFHRTIAAKSLITPVETLARLAKDKNEFVKENTLSNQAYIDYVDSQDSTERVDEIEQLMELDR